LEGATACMEQGSQSITYLLIQGGQGGPGGPLSQIPPGGRPIAGWDEVAGAAFDHPVDAVSAALALRGPGLRIGVHTAAAGGDPWIHLAHTAAILALANPGQVLLSAESGTALAARLPAGAILHSLGRHRLQDLRTVEEVYALTPSGGAPLDLPLRSLGSVPNNLPVQVTSFVGRHQEIAELRRLLAEHRLVTIVGPGGSGKTRLALQTAAQSLEPFPDGIFLVDLSALVDPEVIPSVASAALRLQVDQRRPVQESLVEALAPKRSLLVLDNCEHLITACARLVSTLLLTCPQLRIIATSREPLGVAGELAWAAPVLSLPPLQGAPTLERLSRYDSVRLFAERASAVSGGFALTEQNGPVIAALCCQLDGIPLAIELAAARTRVLSVQQIAERLDDRLSLLTSGSRTIAARHQTLRAAIDWSYDLLTPVERTLWQRLSVFAGGFSLEAAEAVCAAGAIQVDAVLDLLAQLVEKSLVVAEESGGKKRFRLLETMRQYARQRLIESGEEAALQSAHLAWIVGYAETARQGLWSPEVGVWIETLEDEKENVREALQRAEQRGLTDQAIRICGGLWRFWYLRGYVLEHYDRLRRLADSPFGPEVRADLARLLDGLGIFVAEVRGDLVGGERAFTRSIALSREAGDLEGIASAYTHMGGMFSRHGKYEEALPALREAVRYGRGTDNPVLIGLALGKLGVLYSFMGEPELARSALHEAAAIQQRAGDEGGLRATHLYLGHVAVNEKEYAVARDHYEYALALCRKVSDQISLVSVLNGCGEAVYHLGQYAQARAYLTEALTVCSGINDFLFLLLSLEAMAWVSAAEGRAEVALLLAGGTAALRKQFDVSPSPRRRERMAEAMRPAFRAMDEATAQRVMEAGARMSQAELVALACAPPEAQREPQPLPEPLPSPPDEPLIPPGHLTTREQEVLRWLALGLTTKEIGQQLHLSPRTVEKHEENIRAKLQVPNRAALVVLAVRMGLVQGR